MCAVDQCPEELGVSVEEAEGFVDRCSERPEQWVRLTLS